ncbi:MAG: glycosyltransferase family 39 protein [Elusimicrobiota bacterium]
MGKKVIPLLIIVVLALVPRLVNFGTHGLFYWDEAYYALEAKTVPTVLHYVFNGNKQKSVAGLKSELIDKGCIFPTGVAKPGFITLLSIASTVFGSRDYSGHLMSTLFSLLTLILVYVLSMRIYNNLYIASTACLLMAVSGYDILYARNGLPLSACLFFFTLSILLLVSAYNRQWEIKHVFLSGITAGMAVTCHYTALVSSIFVMALIFVYSLIKEWKNTKFNSAVKNMGIYILGLLIIPVSYQIVYMLIKAFLGNKLEGIVAMTYFEYFARQFGWTVQGLNIREAVTNYDVLFYIKAILLNNGWVFLYALVTSVGYFLIKNFKKFNFIEALLLINTAVIFVVWTMKPGVTVARLLSIIFPFTYIMLAKTGCDFYTGLKLPVLKAVVILIGVLVVIQNVVIAGVLINLKSGYPDVASFIKSTGETEVASLCAWPYMQFYLGKKVYANSDRLNTVKDILTMAKERKIKYLIKEFDINEYNHNELEKEVTAILRLKKPFKVFDHKYQIENIVIDNDPGAIKYLNEANLKKVYVYEIASVFK